MSVIAVVLLPLVGSVLVYLVGTRVAEREADAAKKLFAAIAVAPVAVAAVIAWTEFAKGIGSGGFKLRIETLAPWIVHAGGPIAEWSIRYDALTAVMFVVVTTVSALVHLYALGYMKDDPSKPRFFAYLSLFTFAMLALVSADNLLQLFFGWEGVGLASYLLIGFWHAKPSANAAAVKAFVVNRVGDVGFMLGLLAILAIFNSITLDDVFAQAPRLADARLNVLGLDLHALTTICLLLFVGAMGKSAQFILHTWLPDAMEGPTPVSALIHAATMVTAGVFLVARFSPLFELAPDARDVVVVVGAITALFAASVALAQNDIKRVVAYSTCSQLGYMFVALGVGAYGAAIFHLFTHAFFKALLFLGAGAVIHAVQGEQDMRRMGGLAKALPLTWAAMIVGTLSLTGFPIVTAGYYSKDPILEAAFAVAPDVSVASFAFAALLLAALLTSLYSWRLVFMTFHGRSRLRDSDARHLHDAPPVMAIPLALLAVGALGAGAPFAPYFVGVAEAQFWGDALFRADDNRVIETLRLVPPWVKWSPALMMTLGFVAAWIGYVARPALPSRIALRHEPLYLFLLNKWYVDELYDRLLVEPTRRLAQALWKRGDLGLIDKFGPDGAALVARIAGREVSRLQSGYLHHYAFAMIAGAALALAAVLALAPR